MELARRNTKQNPLDHLSDLFADDMQAVNDLILNRIGSDVPQVQEVARYLIESGGKRIRPLLTLASAGLFVDDVSPSVILAGAVEFIHSATLLHDDVVDESDQRRGKASANLVHGNAMVVLVGDFLFSRAFQLMVETDDMRILKSLSDAAAIIAEGEVLQLAHIGDTGMGLEVYKRIIAAKTAALFAAACESGALIAGASEKDAAIMKQYGHHLGMAFQMADDLMDYAADAAQMGKNRGDDFREGKLTLPVLLAYDHDSPFWDTMMKQDNRTDDDLQQAREKLSLSNALAEGYHMAGNHAQQAVLSLSMLSQKRSNSQYLSDLASYVVERDT